MAKQKRKKTKKRNAGPPQAQRWLYGFYNLPNGETASYQLPDTPECRKYVETKMSKKDGHMIFTTEKALFAYIAQTL